MHVNENCQIQTLSHRSESTEFHLYFRWNFNFAKIEDDIDK